MTATARLVRLLGAPLALFAAQPAVAQVQPDKQARSFARIVNPMQFKKVQDLNFAMLNVPTTPGTAVVNPNTDAMTTTGGVIHLGGVPYAALFEAIIPVRNVVIIRIPRQPITLTRVNGTETMTVSNWTLSGNSRRTVAAQEPMQFKVGGTLSVNANQAEGLYVGTFEVDVQYP